MFVVMLMFLVLALILADHLFAESTNHWITFRVMFNVCGIMASKSSFNERTISPAVLTARSMKPYIQL